MSEMYKNIVIAVDGSEASNKALDKAITMAKLYDATLTIANVFDVSASALAIAYRESLEKKAKANADEIVDNAAKKAASEGLTKVKTMVKEGSPRAVIAKVIIPESGADLIIMGAKGHGIMDRIIMGSVSESTMRHATCDVMIVR